jgi:hypothetical protein
MSHLLDLPDEVLLSISTQLSLSDLSSLIQSCHRLSVLIAQSSLVQYLIHTMRHGLYDPLVSDMSIPQRIKALEVWERAWLEFTVSEPSQRYQLAAIGLDDPKRCWIQSGILIGTQFNSLHPPGTYYYLDVSHLLNQPRVVARIDIPNIGGDAHVQSWTYAPESDLMAIILQSVLLSLYFMMRVHRFCIIDLIGDAARQKYSSINSLLGVSIQAPQITVSNLIRSRSRILHA